MSFSCFLYLKTFMFFLQFLFSFITRQFPFEIHVCALDGHAVVDTFLFLTSLEESL